MERDAHRGTMCRDTEKHPSTSQGDSPGVGLSFPHSSQKNPRLIVPDLVLQASRLNEAMNFCCFIHPVFTLLWVAALVN